MQRSSYLHRPEVIIVATELSARSASIIAAMAALLVLQWGDACASEEAVDRATQKALALDAHPDRGGLLFSQYCARCHGSEGQGNASRAIPALAAQRFNYLVRQLANFTGLERDSNTMHGVLSQIELRGPQSWVDIAAFLNKAPTVKRAQLGEGTDLKVGAAIFHGQCASCHRADGHGDADGFVPSLRSQHYSYLVGQIHKLGQGRRHNVDEDLVRFLNGFDDEEISATADYLSRLRGPVPVHNVMRGDGVVVD
jgi:cytochrome c553